MTAYLIDSNVLLDVLEDDPEWYAWSARALASVAGQGTLAINPVIYAEISFAFKRIEELQDLLPPSEFRRLSLPWEAAFLACETFQQYQKRGGLKYAPLPDFFIGAHAAVDKLTLVTRDGSRYRSYFPTVTLIAP